MQHRYTGRLLRMEFAENNDGAKKKAKVLGLTGKPGISIAAHATSCMSHAAMQRPLHHFPRWMFITAPDQVQGFTQASQQKGASLSTTSRAAAAVCPSTGSCTTIATVEVRGMLQIAHRYKDWCLALVLQLLCLRQQQTEKAAKSCVLRNIWNASFHGDPGVY